MDYQITCVCGHRFLVSDKALASGNGTVACPKCRQRLSPIIDPPAPAPTPTTPTSSAPAPELPPPDNADAPPISTPATSADETKRCPFCGEVILKIAKKCKHCGEFLDRTPPPEDAPRPNPLTPAAPTQTPDPHAPPPEQPVIFSVSVSQWDNFWKYLIILTITAAIVFALWLLPVLKDYRYVATPPLLVLAAFFAWIFYLATKNTRVIIRPFRVETETGILSKDMNALELFRISDVELKQNVLERVLGIGTVKLVTQDETSPQLTLYQIPKARAIYKYLQNQIPIAAKQRGAIYMEK